MGDSLRRICIAVGIFSAFLATSRSASAQTGGSVAVNYSPGGSIPSGQLGTVDLYATYTDPDDPYLTLTGPTWNWTATGVDGLSVDISSDAQNPTLNATVSPAGTYSITVKATATWTISTGGTVDVSDQIQFDLCVVGVQKLQFMVGASSYSDVVEVLYVPVGESLSFQAISTPTDATFPADQPVWSGKSGATGKGATTWVTFSDVSTTASDFKTVTATCGDTYVTAYVFVYDAPAPYLPVTVTATGGTFSPDPAPIETSLALDLSAKAERPIPDMSATLGAPNWTWQLVGAQYSEVSDQGPWTDAMGSGFNCSIGTSTTPSPDGTYDYSEVKVTASFPTKGYWNLSFNAQVDYTDSINAEYLGAALAQGKGTAAKLVIKRQKDGEMAYKIIGAENNVVLPGELIDLKMEADPAGATLTDWEWNIPSVAFKDYLPDDKASNFEGEDKIGKTKATIKFYWANGDDKEREVTAKAKINGVWEEAKAKLQVKAPVLNTFEPNIGGVFVGKYKHPSDENALTYLILAKDDKGGFPGIEFQQKVSVPKDSPEGTWTNVQLVKGKRTQVLLGNESAADTKGEKVLDNAFPYAKRKPFDTGKEEPTNDSPSMNLQTLQDLITKSSADNTYYMYILFKPNGNESRYVPLSYIEWSWKGAATQDGAGTGKWSLDKDSDAKEAKPKVLTTDHPIWKKNIKDIEYKSEKKGVLRWWLKDSLHELANGNSFEGYDPHCLKMNRVCFVCSTAKRESSCIAWELFYV